MGVRNGASSGIGAKFTEELAANGLNVVLVARRKDRLEALAIDLATQHDPKIQVVVADLSTESGIKAVKEETSKREVGLLINNACIDDSGQLQTIW